MLSLCCGLSLESARIFQWSTYLGFRQPCLINRFSLIGASEWKKPWILSSSDSFVKHVEKLSSSPLSERIISTWAKVLSAFIPTQRKIPAKEVLLIVRENTFVCAPEWIADSLKGDWNMASHALSEALATVFRYLLLRIEFLWNVLTSSA